MPDICVLGTGYVGLVTGTCLAELGHHVTCVDVDQNKIAALAEGHMPIYEPGLDQLVLSNQAEGRLGFTTRLADAVRPDRLVLFVAVGTPTADDGSADLRLLFTAVAEAAMARAAVNGDGFMVLVVKSTVPVGTSRQIEAILARHLPRSQFAVASNPEFLREGSAIGDFMRPDRIVVGSRDAAALAALREVYAPLTAMGYTLIETATVETSEMIKYASNVFLATKIALINEFARLCDSVGADVIELATGVGMDRRIGSAGLMPGAGFGGSCFPKDLRALINLAINEGCPMLIAHAVVASNDFHKHAATTKVVGALHDDVNGLRIAVLGLAFKAGTDDVREAPALKIIENLIERGATVAAFDPVASPGCKAIIPDAEYADTIEDAVRGADAAIVMTEWPEIARSDWTHLRSCMARPLVVDLRNLLNPQRMTDLGFQYVSMGRASASSFAPERSLEELALEPGLQPLAGLLAGASALAS